MDHIIPGDECLVGPICQFTLQPKLGEEIPKGAKYEIQIPHLVPDVNKVKNHIRIRDCDIHNDSLTKKDISKETDEISFDIDEKYITVHTTHFSTYIVTVEGINCCSSRALALFFGSLDNTPDAEPLASLRVYMTRDTSDIKDFQKVSCNSIMFNAYLKHGLQFGIAHMWRLDFVQGSSTCVLMQ